MKNKKIKNFAIAWCDNGDVDSRFMQGVLSLFTDLEKFNLKIDKYFHIIGNLISVQRQRISKIFEDSDSEWVLFIDSDIFVNAEMIKKMFEFADKDKCPMISGLYFILSNPYSPVPTPHPAIFDFTTEKQLVSSSYIPHDQLIKIDAAGLGLCLIHKSVFDKLNKAYPEYNYFNIDSSIYDNPIGEDTSFFLKLKELNIPVHAHTGVLPQHIKKYPLDINYHNWWWGNYTPNQENLVQN